MIFTRKFSSKQKYFFSSAKKALVKTLFTLWVALLCGLSLPVAAQDGTLKVGVAANLLLPMQQIKQLFEQKFAGQLVLIPGSSGKLTAQILNGAPYDIFLSADMKYPAKIKNARHADMPPLVLLRGKLVFWSKEQPDQPLESWLTSEQVRSIAIAQPELAPYGNQAKDWMQERKLYSQLLPKVIFGESIGQVNQYIRSGTVEAAFTAVSAMHADALKDEGYWQPLNVEEGDPSQLDHGMVVLTNATANQRAVNQFLEFIQSPIADKVFLDFGYKIPGSSP
jgi:molybdate transport system substrate-binding protein